MSSLTSNGVERPRPQAEALSVKNLRSGGRSLLGEAEHNGQRYIVKIRRDFDDLLIEKAGHTAMRAAGYDVVDEYVLGEYAELPCALVSKVDGDLLFTECLKENADGLIAIIQAVSRQFRRALSTNVESEFHQPNTKYFLGRRELAEQNFAHIHERLGGEFLQKDQEINGTHCAPIIDIVTGALQKLQSVAMLPKSQLAITHGDPGDMNIFTNGTLIDYEVAGLNDPVSEAATALHWQLFLGPTFAPRYHTHASPLYQQAAKRPGFHLESDNLHTHRFTQPMKHRIPAALELLQSYGPRSIEAAKPALTHAFQERFSTYWTLRSLTSPNMENFSDDDLKAVCLSIALFTKASESPNAQNAIEEACTSLV